MTTDLTTRSEEISVTESSAAIAPKTQWRRTFGLREMGVYYALLLLVVVLAVTTTFLGQANYLSILNLTNVVYQSSLIAIMAVAMTPESLTESERPPV